MSTHRSHRSRPGWRRVQGENVPLSPTRVSSSRRSTSKLSRSPANATRRGGSRRCVGCGGCTTVGDGHQRSGDHRRGSGRGTTVETVGRDDARLGQAGVPFDRVAAQAYSSFDGGDGHHGRQGGRARGADRSSSTAPARARSRSAHCRSASSASPEPLWSSTTGQGHVRREHRVHRRRQRAPDSRQRAGLGGRRRHVAAHHVRLGRDAVLRHFAISLGGDLVRMSRRASSTTGPAATPNCWACTSPTPASTSSSACWWITRSRNCKSNVVYKGALQGDAERSASPTRTPCGSATC